MHPVPGASLRDAVIVVPAEGYEQVVFCRDAASGLEAIIALHSTALGPALGGTRMRPYPTSAAALADVLDLARAMTYKNALAGLDHGGGKAVIVGDPARDKTPQLLHAYGRFVAGLAGRYLTACDVGTTVEDMDVVATQCSFVTGRSPQAGGAGDSGVLTALGVVAGMRAAVAQRFGATRSLAGLRVGVAGVGKVGRRLVDHLVREGAAVVVTDPDAVAVAEVRERHPGVEAVADVGALLQAELDVYSPNALGGAIDVRTAETIEVGVVCGGANNQLAHAGLDQVLADRGVLYAPDYLVNAGGVIAVADEWGGYSDERARAAVAGIHQTADRVFALAEAEAITPLAAADRLAEARIAAGSPHIWLPPAGTG
jgi:valine dehydrogenase (NAD+)